MNRLVYGNNQMILEVTYVSYQPQMHFTLHLQYWPSD